MTDVGAPPLDECAFCRRELPDGTPVLRLKTRGRKSVVCCYDCAWDPEGPLADPQSFGVKTRAERDAEIAAERRNPLRRAQSIALRAVSRALERRRPE